MASPFALVDFSGARAWPAARPFSVTRPGGPREPGAKGALAAEGSQARTPADFSTESRDSPASGQLFVPPCAGSSPARLCPPVSPWILGHPCPAPHLGCLQPPGPAPLAVGSPPRGRIWPRGSPRGPCSVGTLQAALPERSHCVCWHLQCVGRSGRIKILPQGRKYSPRPALLPHRGRGTSMKLCCPSHSPRPSSKGG